MLVLSRKRSERIMIGPSIRVTVVKLDGNQVRLGIEAPDAFPIVRSELLADNPAREDRRDESADADIPKPRRRPRRAERA